MTVNIIDTVLYSVTVGGAALAILQSLTPAAQGQTKSFWLTGLLALILIYALGELFIAAGAYTFAPHLAGIQLPLRMLLAPVLYFYTCSLTMNLKVDTRAVRYALSGPLAMGLIMLPFLGISSEDKLALALPATRDPDLFFLAKVTCAAATVLFVVYVAVCLTMALRAQSLHRARMMQLYSNLEHRSLDWLKVMLLIWGGAWTLHAINEALWVFDFHAAGLAAALTLFETSALIAFVYLALNQAAYANEVRPVESLSAKVRKTSLDSGRMERIAERLKTNMLQDRLYAESDLSLRRLAEVSRTTENHLSETFSQFLHTNFFNFVNEYRISEAKRLLGSTDISITTIAVEVGFNSRSTFNSSFKKATGITPREFRSQGCTATASEQPP
jgi:AraC-like DNA-binding protein